MGYRDINVTMIRGDELMTTSVSSINILNTTTMINTSEALATECHEIYFCDSRMDALYYIAIDITREVIFWLGVIFNTIFFAVVFSNRKLWTSTFLLLALLNFFDSFFLVLDYCDFIFHYLTVDNICFWYFFRQFSQYGSLITIVFLAWNRWQAICRPLNYYTGRHQNLRRGFLATSCIFLVSVLLATPKFTTVCLVDGVDKIDASSPTAVYLFIVNACIDLVAYSISVIIVCIAYGRIIYTLKKNNSAKKENQSKKDKNLITMLVVNSVVFFICMLPKAIDYAMYVYTLILEPPWVEESTVSDYFEFMNFKYGQFVWLFVSINASVNSIIYTALSSDYQEGLRNLGRRIVSCCKHDSRVAAVKLSNDYQLMDIKDKSKNPVPTEK